MTTICKNCNELVPEGCCTCGPDQELVCTASVTDGDPHPDWDAMSVGYCQKCGDATVVINGLCYDCRPRFKEATP